MKRMTVDDYIGKSFGELIVISFVGRNSSNRRIFECSCSCGKITKTTDSNLKQGVAKSCGHLRDLTPQKAKKTNEEKKENVRKWEQENKRWLKPESKLKALDRCRKYRESHRLELRERHKDRMKTDIQYAMKHRLKARFKMARKNLLKTGSAIRDLGCSIEQLKIHLESLFKDGMNWDNYGKWHIDHVLPLDSFDLTDPEQTKKACHYTNLQPLWAKENLSKGSKIQ